MKRTLCWLLCVALVSPIVACLAAENELIEARVMRRGLSLESAENKRAIEPRIGPATFASGYVESAPGVFRCEVAKEGEEGKGVRFYYELNQEVPTPIVATCWSRGEDVQGNVGSDYSLYLDVIYADDAPLWGQVATFPVGDSDWSQGRVMVFPDKPIKSISCYGMFRGHVGAVEFKDFELYEYKFANQVAYFDGAPVEISAENAPLDAPCCLFREAGGDEFSGLRLDGKWTPGTPGRWNDVLVWRQRAEDRHGTVELPIKLRNASGEDRAFTFYFVFPIPQWSDENATLLWYDGPRAAREVGANEYRATRKLQEVGRGETSYYPLGVVGYRLPSDERARDRELGALSLGVSPDYPAFYRVVCNGATRELYLAFDLALTAESPEAELRIPILELQTSSAEGKYFYPWFGDDPIGSNPFRVAWDNYRMAYPDAFRVLAQKQGNWMAFAKVSKVKDWQDFGFQFKEGIDETDEDDARGLTSFRYTEPMTWWQQIQKSETSPKSRPAALQTAKEIALKNERNANGSLAWNVGEAQSLFTTGFRDENGEFFGNLLDTPWCDGVVWSMNDAPGLARLAKEGKLKNADNAALFDAGIEPIAGFETKWNEKLADELYGKPIDPTTAPTTRDELIKAQAQPGVDGEYIDSSEGYVTATLDFDRSHFAGMTTPLTFDAKSGRPAIFRGLIAFEYARQIAQDVHARGKLAMANATPTLHFWLAPLLDVLGTETNWRWGGDWRPMPDDELLYRRAMCCGKPYCFLQNTNFDEFTREHTELYMKRALAYGMFPSFFSQDASTRHYFDNPDLYERDRALFKKYMPIVTAVAEAGWEPIPLAEASDAAIYVERFGAIDGSPCASNPLREQDAVYLTVFNDSKEPKEARVVLNRYFAGVLANKNATIRELTQGVDVELKDAAFEIGALDGQDVRVYEIRWN